MTEASIRRAVRSQQCLELLFGGACRLRLHMHIVEGYSERSHGVVAGYSGGHAQLVRCGPLSAPQRVGQTRAPCRPGCRLTARYLHGVMR